MNNDTIDPDVLHTKIVHVARFLLDMDRVELTEDPSITHRVGKPPKAGGGNLLCLAAAYLLSPDQRLSAAYLYTPQALKQLGGREGLSLWLRLSNAKGMHWFDTLVFDSLTRCAPTLYGTQTQQQGAWAVSSGLPMSYLGVQERHYQALKKLEGYAIAPKLTNGALIWREGLPEGDVGADERSLRTQSHPPGAFRAAPVEQPGVGPLPHLATHPGPGTGGPGTPGLSPTDHVLGHRRLDEDQGGGAVPIRHPRPHPLPAVYGGREGVDLLREGPGAPPGLRVVGSLQRRGGPPGEDRAEDPLETEVRAVRPPCITRRRQGSSLPLLAPGLSSGSMSKTRVKILIDDEGRMTLEVDGVLQSHHGYIDIRPTSTDGSANRVGCGVVLLGQDPRVAQFTEEVLKGTYHEAAPVVTYLGTAPYTPPFYISKTPVESPPPSEPVVPATRIDIDKEGGCQVYVEGQLIGGLLDIHFAALEETGRRAVVLVVPKGDPRIQATIEAVRAADGSKIISPLYIDQKEHGELDMEEARKKVTAELKEEVELDRLKKLVVDTLEKELEKDVGYRIAMSGKTPPPDMAAWKQEVAEAMAKWDKGPSTTGVLPLPQTHEQTGRWTQMFLDRQKKAEGTPPRGRPSLVAMLDEVFAAPSPKPAVPGPYSATGMDSSNVPELELKHRFTTDGTKGLKAYFTLNGKELEGVFGWREYLDALARLLKVELRVPYADKRGGAPPFHAMYKGHLVKVVYKAEDLGESFKHITPKMMDTPTKSTPEERRRAMGLLSEESVKGPLSVTPIGPKGSVPRANGGPTSMPATDLYLTHLQRPIDRTTPELTFEQRPDGTSILRVDEKAIHGVTGTHEEKTPLGPLFFQYVAETDKRLGTPITLVRYQDKPALLVFATKP